MFIVGPAPLLRTQEGFASGTTTGPFSSESKTLSVSSNITQQTFSACFCPSLPHIKIQGTAPETAGTAGSKSTYSSWRTSCIYVDKLRKMTTLNGWKTCPFVHLNHKHCLSGWSLVILQLTSHRIWAKIRDKPSATWMHPQHVCTWCPTQTKNSFVMGTGVRLMV